MIQLLFPTEYFPSEATDIKVHMSEKSKDKTKRLLKSFLMNYEWSYQYSIFYVEIKDSVNLIDDCNIVKKRLRKTEPTIPFLFCYRTLYKKELGGLQAYATIYTTKKTDAIKLAARSIESEVNVLSKAVSQRKIESTVNAISKQNLHALDAYFGKPIRRYQLINQKHLKTLPNEREIEVEEHEYY